MIYTYECLQLLHKVFNSTGELKKLIGIPTKEAKVEIETNLLIAEAKRSKCLIWFKAV